MKIGIRETRSLQQEASNPATSAWVEASAGTGKTKVLTDRILRLLLDGTPAANILCLTLPNPPLQKWKNVYEVAFYRGPQCLTPLFGKI